MQSPSTRKPTPLSEAKVLYLTYDGLLDPLGQSQILPYVKELATHTKRYYLVSFEKDRDNENTAKLKKHLNRSGIIWIPLRFSKAGSLLHKLYDLISFYLVAIRLCLFSRPTLVHARSHAPAQVASLVSRIFNIPFIFDCRGLWVDERVDKGGWNLSRMDHRLQYNYYKRLEVKLFSSCTHLVILTNSAISVVRKICPSTTYKTTVIPCCADYNLFEPRPFPNPNDQLVTKKRLFRGCYLGSIGQMYLIQKVLRLFVLSHECEHKMSLVLITPDSLKANQMVHDYVPQSLRALVQVISLTREQVSQHLRYVDFAISFITPTYARKAASPTKYAECCACGVPTLCNDGIGDMSYYTNILDSGLSLAKLDDESLRQALYQLPDLLMKGGHRLRDSSYPYFSLEVGVSRYLSVYNKALGQ